jgi:tetratricopeptide (TPR) repeat protein
MTDDVLSKIGILLRQEKYADAERFLKDLLSREPNNIDYLAMLAEVNLQQNKLDHARTLIDNAIGISPGSPHLFYIKSRIAIQQEKLDEAESIIQQAIQLDPADADYYAVWSSVKLSRKQFQSALELADKSLAIDSENILALNIRSTALLKLDRKEQSFQTIQGALREDPNNAYTHANYGWGLLERGDHKKALEHFREALKNDPNFQYAQAGMIEAIKATNPVYRMYLKYAFWMGNLTSKYQWAVIIGFYFGTKFLRLLAQQNAMLQLILTPLIVALGIFAFSTWVLSPISNLFLRLNKYGQYLLDRNEKLNSNFVGLSLLTFIIGILLYAIIGGDGFLALAVFGFGMMVPFASMFTDSKNKVAFLIYPIAMLFIGLVGLFLTFTTNELFNIGSTAFIIALLAYQWIANFLLIKENNK